MRRDFESVKKQYLAAEDALAKVSGRGVETMRKTRDQLLAMMNEHPDNPAAGAKPEGNEVELRKTRIGKLIDALRQPDPAFKAVPNKIRQDSAEAIEELLARMAVMQVELTKLKQPVSTR